VVAVEPLELSDGLEGEGDVDRGGELGPHAPVGPGRRSLPRGLLPLEDDDPPHPRAGQFTGHGEADRPATHDRHVDPFDHGRRMIPPGPGARVEQ
jgi:hypothetical protein